MNCEELFNKAQEWRMSYPLGDEYCISLSQNWIYSQPCVFWSDQDQVLKDLHAKVDLEGNLRKQVAKKWMSC